MDEYGNPVQMHQVPGSGGSNTRGRGNRDRSRSFGDHQGYGQRGESAGRQRQGGEGNRREKRNSENNGRHYEEVEIGREDDIW